MEDSIHKLNNKELLYLKLLAFGFSRVRICFIMDTSSYKLELIRSTIELKLDCSNWQDIIAMAFRNKLLHPKDYVIDEVKALANRTVSRMFMENSESLSQRKRTIPSKFAIQNELTKYLAMCFSGKRGASI
ncbi:MAG: hypothetical protein Aureis2KO_25930 [Aureisphaera sp.]